jgi:hypothetical protein
VLHRLGDLPGQRAKSAAVSRGSNACTGEHPLNQATPPASGTRSTLAHGRWCAVSMGPTGSTYARTQASAIARSMPYYAAARGDHGHSTRCPRCRCNRRGGGGGYPPCLTTKVTKVKVVEPTLPVTCQQPSVGKVTPLA